MGSEEAAPGPGPGLTLRKINVKQKRSAATATESTAAANAEATPEEPVTPAGRLFMEPGMNCYILCALAFERPIDVEEFKQTLLATLVNHKRFHSVIRKDRKGRDVWVEVPVSVDDHIIVSPVPSPWTPTFLHNYMTELAVAPSLDLTRPMWQCHILNHQSHDSPDAPDAADATTGDLHPSHVVIRVHHALGDGTSLMSLLLACTRRLGHPDELPSVPVAKRKEKKRRAGCCGGVMRKAIDVVALLWNTFVGVFLFTSTAVWLKDSDSAVKGKAGVEKERKKMVVETVDMADLGVVKQAVNATVNDVFMAFVGEALLHYLEGRHGVAVLLKPKMELASMMDGGSQSRWGNHMGYLIMNIPMKHRSNPLDYVRAAKKATDKKKASLEGVFTYISGAAMMNLMGPVPPCILTRRVLLQTTLAISNVPGPTEPVTFGGNPLVGIYPTVSGHPQAISIYLQSYNGKASLVIMSAESAMPDPEVLGRLCRESLQGMVRAAKEAAATSATTTTTTATT